jgi:hypothetical protein
MDFNNMMNGTGTNNQNDNGGMNFNDGNTNSMGFMNSTNTYSMGINSNQFSMPPLPTANNSNNNSNNNMMGTFNNSNDANPGMFASFPEAQPQMMQMMRKRQVEDQDASDDTFQSAAKRAHISDAGSDNHSTKNNFASASTDKPSDLIPPSEEGLKFYSRNDVLCGRGGGTNVHPGNRRFRDLINANRRAYLKARKNDKPAISRSIVRTIREMNGRFLKKDEKGLWFEIGDDGAREKTSQALRQRAPEMKKILFEDEQRMQQQQAQEVMMQRNMMQQMNSGFQGNLSNGMQMNHHSMMNTTTTTTNNNNNMGGGNNFNQQYQNHQGNYNSAPSHANQNNYYNNGDNSPALNNNMDSSSLLARYSNLMQQKNMYAQEKNMLMQRLAMSGLNPATIQNQQSNIDNMTQQTLMGQTMKSVTPRGA